LVEMVVVVAIISLLSVLSIGAIQVANRQSMQTSARVEMRDIKGLFEAFAVRYGQYPPVPGPYSSNGDFCPACVDPPGAWWVNALLDMKRLGFIEQKQVDDYQYDPWGSPYAYDDNFGQYYATSSLFCSAGPDKRKGDVDNDTDGWGSGDDICDNFRHEGVKLW